jgi:hypothetical protein
MKTPPPPIRSASAFASITGHAESSNPASPAFGRRSYDTFHRPAFGRGGASTICASMFRHWPPNTTTPASAIRSTLCAGVPAGATFGAGAGAVCRALGALTNISRIASKAHAIFGMARRYITPS